MGPPINLYRQLPPSAARVHVPVSETGRGDSAAVPPAKPKSVRIEKAYTPPVRRIRRGWYRFGWLLGGVIVTGASIGWWLRPHAVLPAHNVPSATTIQAYAQSAQSPVAPGATSVATTVPPVSPENSHGSVEPRHVERVHAEPRSIRQPAGKRMKSPSAHTSPQSRQEAARFRQHASAQHLAPPLAQSPSAQDRDSALGERVMTSPPEEIKLQPAPVKSQDWMRYLSHQRITDIPDQFVK